MDPFERLKRENRELRARIAALEAELASEREFLGSQVKALKAELAAARKDAERYRWLADKVIAPDYGDNDQGRKGYFIQHCKGPNWIGGETLDAAIDAALGKGEAA